MSEALNQIREAKAAIAAAEGKLRSIGKEAIVDALYEAFADESVNNVVFGVSSEPYNDEQPGQGTYGPFVNYFDTDEETGEPEFSYDDEDPVFYGSYYGHSGKGEKDHAAARPLSEVLTALEWDVAAESLGMSVPDGEAYGGETTAFVAYRNEPGSADFSLDSMSFER